MRNPDRRTWEQRKADASAWMGFISFLAILLIVVVAMVMKVNAAKTAVQPDAESSVFRAVSPSECDGRLPGDDTPAQEPEEAENELIEAALLTKSHRIDNVTVTHYCICQQCCGKAPDHPAYGITASGRRATPYVSVAVDPSLIPLGADVLVDYGDGEIHYYRADDAGSGVGGCHIDLCVGSHDEALQMGHRTATVYWVAQEE